MKFGRITAASIAIALFAVPALAAGPGTGSYTYVCAPNQVISAGPYPTSGPYTAGGDGIVTGVAPNDVITMYNAGCKAVAVGGGSNELLGRLIGANMNVTTDQPFVWFAAPSSVYRVTKITCTNASTSLTTAVGGVYTRLSKGGSAIVAATQVYSSLTGSTLALDLTIAATPGITYFASTPATASVDGAPVLALTTAQGAAATADCYVFGMLGQ